MGLKLNQWKGQLGLLLALCMTILLAGCGREAGVQTQTAGIQASGIETSETGTPGTGTSGTQAAGTKTAGDQTAGAQASGVETSETGTPETGTAETQTSGTGTAGDQTAGAQASGVETSGTGTPETGTAGTQTSGTGTAGAQTAETQTSGTGTAGDQTAGTQTSGTGTAEAPGAEPAASLAQDGSYTTAEDVSLYLHTYGELPANFITKKEANALGWSGGSLEPYAPGKCIGGDKFGNYEGVLPEGSYHECDIDTLGAKSRGAKRLVYSDDGSIYYTEDHYGTFTQLYGEE